MRGVGVRWELDAGAGAGPTHLGGGANSGEPTAWRHQPNRTWNERLTSTLLTNVGVVLVAGMSPSAAWRIVISGCDETRKAKILRDSVS